MTIQVKATEQCFPVILFIMLCKVVLTFESVDEIILLKCEHSSESYWAVLSCGTVYYALQGCSIFSVSGWNEILLCDRSIKSHWAYFCPVLIIVVYFMVLTFRSILLLSFPLHILHVLFFSYHFFLFKDHNYGQPPPMTPPDSNSPGPEDGDTGNEDEEDDGVTRCIW